MVQNEKTNGRIFQTNRRIFRLETFSSGRRIKNPYITNQFYLSEEEVLKLACGICIGLLSKYKYPVVKIYDDESADKLFDIVTISSRNSLLTY